MRRLTACVALLCALTAAAAAQDLKPGAPARAEDTRAYLMLHAREASAAAELEKMLGTYTPTFPAVLSKRYELDVVRREAAKMLSTAPGRLDRLSAAYGELVLRMIAVEVEVRDALATYTPQHPQVREKLSALSRAEREALEQMR